MANSATVRRLGPTLLQPLRLLNQQSRNKLTVALTKASQPHPLHVNPPPHVSLPEAG